MTEIGVDWTTPYGFSWTPADDNAMELHSHALRDGDEVWLIDPIDGDVLDVALSDLGGRVAHVVVLLDRHQRDSAALAERYGARLHVVAGPIRQDVPTRSERFDTAIDGSPFTVVPVRSNGKLWQERALWWPEHELLVVAEALGSSDAFRAGSDAAVAVHPVLRLVPPRSAFVNAVPKTILFGHGPAVTEDATTALRTALAESRTATPKFLVESARSAIAAVTRRS
ncbi:MAG: hypothetical protein JWL76_491 [Thermoleophilia bacterium]|nr:hypothetical protein [Thermoleophilia bacterium]